MSKFKIAKFEKVSFEQFKNDWELYNIASTEDEIKKIYDNIKLPKRATKGSAGYDFFIPFDYSLATSVAVKITTGIRCKMEDGWVLCEFPRSGIGFKYGIHLANTVGIIDSDYYGSDNEGHIFVKLVNDSAIKDHVKFSSGDAFCQGIFIPYGLTEDDMADGIRNGGFGSTSKKE